MNERNEKKRAAAMPNTRSSTNQSSLETSTRDAMINRTPAPRPDHYVSSPATSVGSSPCVSLDDPPGMRDREGSLDEYHDRHGTKRGRYDSQEIISMNDLRKKRNATEKLRVRHLAEAMGLIRDELCVNLHDATKVRRMSKQRLLDLSLKQLKARRTALEKTLQWAKTAVEEARLTHASAPLELLPAETVYKGDSARNLKLEIEMVSKDNPFAILQVQGLNIVSMNPAFEALTGYTAKDNCSMLNLVTRQDTSKLFRLLSELILHPNRHGANFKLMCINRAHEICNASITLTVTRDASGSPAYLTCHIQQLADEPCDEPNKRSNINEAITKPKPSEVETTSVVVLDGSTNETASNGDSGTNEL